MARRYYTYRHKMADTGEIFYIGKGHDRRVSSSHNRNSAWHCTVLQHGLIAEIIEYYDSEKEALAAEMKLIAEYRISGAPLVNRTAGGQGVSGMRHSEESIAKNRAAHIGKTLSEEHKRKISEAGKRRYELNPEDRFKSTQHLKGKPSHRRGKNLSEETRCKMSASRMGHIVSQETRDKISQVKKLNFSIRKGL